MEHKIKSSYSFLMCEDAVLKIEHEEPLRILSQVAIWLRCKKKFSSSQN